MGTRPRQQVQCPVCSGWGVRRTRTGFRWLLGEHVVCPRCKGEGWVLSEALRQWTGPPTMSNARPPVGGGGIAGKDH